MTLRLLTEHYLEFLSLRGGCIGSSESTLVKKDMTDVTFACEDEHDAYMKSSTISFRKDQSVKTISTMSIFGGEVLPIPHSTTTAE